MQSITGWIRNNLNFLKLRHLQPSTSSSAAAPVDGFHDDDDDVHHLSTPSLTEKAYQLDKISLLSPQNKNPKMLEKRSRKTEIIYFCFFVQLF